MYFAAIIICNARRIGQPSYSAKLFNTSRHIDFGRGNAIPELEIPSLSSDTGMKSLVYECSQFWNNLPNSIRKIPSLRGFKTALFKHFSNTDTQQPPFPHPIHIKYLLKFKFLILYFHFYFILILRVWHVTALHLVGFSMF